MLAATHAVNALNSYANFRYPHPVLEINIGDTIHF